MRPSVGGALLLMLALATAGESPAQTSKPVMQTSKPVIRGVDAQAILRLMKAGGVGFDSVDQIDAETIRLVSAGAVTLVNLSLCQDRSSQCGRLAFVKFFDKQDGVDLKWINSFNQKAGLARMYQDPDGDHTMSFSLDIDRGVTEEFVTNLGTLWNAEVRAALVFKPQP